MVRASSRISDSFVERTNTPGTYRDPVLKGFALKVSSARLSDGRQILTKVFLVNNKIRGTGKGVTLTLGAYGVLSAEDARREAEQTLKLMYDGVNPKTAKETERTARAAEQAKNDAAVSLTLQKVLDEYLSNHSEHKESTQKFYRYTLNGACKQWLGMPILHISEDMVRAKYTAIAKKQPVKAESFRRCLRALFLFAQSAYKGMGIQNPVSIIQELKLVRDIEPRNRIIESEDLERWFKGVNGLRNEIYRDYFLLLILTGLRRGEAASLKWSDVEFDRKRFTVRNTKNGSDHQLPMTDDICRLFKRIRAQRKPGQFVFYSADSKTGHIKDVRHQQNLISEAAGGIDIDPHDIRRTFASVAAKHLPGYVVKALLNHSTKSDVTQYHYIRLKTEDLLEPLTAINAIILERGRANICWEPERKKVAALSTKGSC